MIEIRLALEQEYEKVQKTKSENNVIGFQDSLKLILQLKECQNTLDGRILLALIVKLFHYWREFYASTTLTPHSKQTIEILDVLSEKSLCLNALLAVKKPTERSS